MQTVIDRQRYGPWLGGGDSDLDGRMGVATDNAAAASYVSTTAVITKDLRESSSQDSVVDSVCYKLWTTT